MKSLKIVVLPALLAAKLVAGSDALTAIPGRENALTEAVRVKNKYLVSTLTDKDFHVTWYQGTAVRSLQTDMSREAWIDNLSHLRIESYEIEILKVASADTDARSQSPSAAFVTLTEFWTVLSPNGRRIEKRLDSFDVWIRKQREWKLASRLSRFP